MKLLSVLVYVRLLAFAGIFGMIVSPVEAEVVRAEGAGEADEAEEAGREMSFPNSL